MIRSRRLLLSIAKSLLVAGAGCAISGVGLAQGRVTPADVAKIVPGKTTKTEVREILGAPARAHQLRAEQGENWEYPYRGDFERRTFWVEFNPDGTVRSTNDTRDFNSGPYRGP
jgi:outer membrane protein assembly factor BamE (lipoprotein component of BamABCDE complex)